MNIFYLSNDPEKAAKMMYNKHVVKMILETAQLLCTAHIVHEGNNANVPYKATHKNHPSAIWARQSADNYEWLYFHMLAHCFYQIAERDLILYHLRLYESQYWYKERDWFLEHWNC